MSASHVIGLDIGGTNARAALLALGRERPGPEDASSARSADENREVCGVEILLDRRRRIRDDTSPEAVVDVIASLARECADAGGLALGDLVGVGIGIAAQLSADGRVVLNAPNLGWRDVALAEALTSSMPEAAGIGLYNDLSAIAWGERACGGARGHDHLLAVYVGTGVGSGLILGGELYEGAGGKAGEIGHAKVTGFDGLCGCGQHGCIEALAGGRSLERRIAADIATGDAEALVAWLSEREEGPVDVLPEHVDAAAGAGVGYARSLWDEVSDALGDVLASAIATLNPSALLLGGGVLENAPNLRARTLERMSARTVETAWDDVSVLRPALGDDAGALGAGLLVSRRER